MMSHDPLGIRGNFTANRPGIRSLTVIICETYSLSFAI